MDSHAAANGKWTKERAITEIQRFHLEHGRPPLQPELKAPLPSSSFLFKQFGGLQAAVRAAGFEPVGRGKRAALKTPSVPDSPPRHEAGKPEEREWAQIAIELAEAIARIDAATVRAATLKDELAAHPITRRMKDDGWL